MSKDLVIAFDIGGSKIQSAVFDLRRKKILDSHKTKTPKAREKFLKTILEISENFLSKYDKRIKGIGVALAGVIDSGGNVRRSPNLKFLNGFNLKNYLEKKLNLEAKIDHDLRSFLRKEMTLGEFKKVNSGLVIGIGTGVGGAWLIDKKIWRGAHNNASEIGHLVIKKGKKYFYLEELVSARKMPPGFRSGKEPFFRTGTAPRFSQKYWDEIGENLGVALAGIVNAFDPEMILIVGGLAKAWPYYVKNTKKYMKKFILSPLSRKVKLKAKDDPLGGVIGAALLFKI